MFHNDDTLKFLDTYQKNNNPKEQKKINGHIKTKRESNGVPKFVWYAVVVFIGYFVVTNLMDRIETKKLPQKVEATEKQTHKVIKEAIQQPVKIQNGMSNVTREQEERMVKKSIEDLKNNSTTIILQNTYKQEPLKEETKAVNTIQETKINPSVEMEVREN